MSRLESWWITSIKNMIVKMKEWKTIRLEVCLIWLKERIPPSSCWRSVVESLCNNSEIGLGSFFNCVVSEGFQIWNICGIKDPEKCLTLLGSSIWWSKDGGLIFWLGRDFVEGGLKCIKSSLDIIFKRVLCRCKKLIE